MSTLYVGESILNKQLCVDMDIVFNVILFDSFDYYLLRFFFLRLCTSKSKLAITTTKIMMNRFYSE